MLYDMALDSFDKPNLAQQVAPCSPSRRQQTHSLSSSNSTEDEEPVTRTSPSSLNLNAAPTPEPIVVHPGLVIAILHLLPSIEHETNVKVRYLPGIEKLLL